MMASQKAMLHRVGLALALALLLVMPWLLGSYQLRLFTEAVIFSLYAVSYNMLLGYAGLLSFGHAMFFGWGAFSFAVALNHFPGIPLMGAVMLAVASTTVIGLVVGVLLLRVKGTPFALLTLAFNALVFAIGIKWHSVTGGDDGLSIATPALNLGFTDLVVSSGPNFYYFTLVIVGAAIAFAWYFTRTAMGQSVLLIRENEERMRFLGYNTNVSRLILFVLSGALAGLAGSFYAILNSFVSLDAVSIEMTTKVLLMTFIGGTGQFLGPVAGAFFFTYVQNFLSDLTDNWPLIMGALFIAMVLWVPGGLAGLAAKLSGGRKDDDPDGTLAGME
ncbi:MAG: branched-chain amino acid ABC transporter permease [Desulfarculus sp.]|nr:branched-chain amino acid ABC transporter permease [Pseudomonadota bacterium]MBV1715616.1 branched-chain amino acid ABC transporter permease [Desulfarculus sp.]MBU4576868.1 branched-chain amino acid ABC transporter permease [Pseudomonadota bacterium]MBU4600140.1 branched-chain amino acid ABC transporter permease [Pseudomonadota bacterium]MBV1738852.1 branched-chain amino acid ABC transporter permease [Desulfarculus sp.]